MKGKTARAMPMNMYSVRSRVTPFLPSGTAKTYHLKIDRANATPKQKKHWKAFKDCNELRTGMPVMSRNQSSDYLKSCLAIQKSSKPMSLRKLKQELRPNLRK